MRHLTLFALTALTLSGCAQMNSSEVATSDIEARITVTATGDGETLVEAELTHDRATWSTYVNLDGGDVISVRSDGHTHAMSSHETLNVIGYGARMPTDRGGAEFVVGLDRPAFDSAPNSKVRLPARFRLFTPARATYDIDYDTIVLEWDDPSRDEMHLEFEGGCIRDESVTVRHDEGLFLVRPGTLATRSSWDGHSCEVQVTVSRVRTGALDSAFASGQIEARQVRHTHFWVEGL